MAAGEGAGIGQAAVVVTGAGGGALVGFPAVPAAAGGVGAASAAMDDPYNIPIDLTKIKRTEKPAKTFEEKT